MSAEFFLKHHIEFKVQELQVRVQDIWVGGVKFLLSGRGSFRVLNVQNISNVLRLEFIFTSVMKNSKILRKYCVERSKANGLGNKLNRALKWSILRPQNLASMGDPM